MPSYCDFEMKVTGSKNNVREFLNVLKRKDCDEPHFQRIIEASVYKEETLENSSYTAYIKGCCAWSVHTCMLNGDGTYNNDIEDEEQTITLESESERLGINIEVWSKETSLGFAEHYIYQSGEEVLNECFSCEYTSEETDEDTDLDKEFYKNIDTDWGVWYA